MAGDPQQRICNLLPSINGAFFPESYGITV